MEHLSSKASHLHTPAAMLLPILHLLSSTSLHFAACSAGFGGYGVYGRRLSSWEGPARELHSFGGYGAYGQSFGGYGAYGQSEP